MSGTEASRGSVDSTTAVPLQLNQACTPSFMARKRARSHEHKGEYKQSNKKQKIHTDEVRLQQNEAEPLIVILP